MLPEYTSNLPFYSWKPEFQEKLGGNKEKTLSLSPVFKTKLKTFKHRKNGKER
jgi:hypothetical protein